jgi:hypothetical protein
MVIVSLTTIPSRLPNLYTTLSSLLNQTVPCDIVVNIPKQYTNFSNNFTIPDFLQDPRIRVNRCRDYGPSTKLLGLVETTKLDPHERIVVVDDDRIYPRDLVERFVTAGKVYPGYVFTICGWEVETLTDGLISYSKKLNRGIEFQREGFIDILGGCGGFSLSAFQIPINNELYDIPNTDRKYYVDDVLFSGFLTRNGIPIYMLIGNDPPRHKNDQIDSLCDTNTYGNRFQCNFDAIQYFITEYGIWK